ncbi:MAG: tetratricopeptide repeat protein [Bacteroidales bacterium]|nr:tetratricopeptide repeat protein [Bacteroidales bacterium]
MKNFLSGILFCVLALSGFAQDEYVDSLRRELAVSDDDKTKIGIYGELFDYFYQYDNNIADNYADTILLYSIKCKSEYFFASGYSCKGIVKYAMGDYVASAKYYGYAEKIANKIQDTTLLPLIYTGFGNIYYQYENYKLAHHYFDEAIQKMKLLKNYESCATTLVNIANLYYKEEKYDTILMLYDSALNITSDFNIKIAIYNNIAYIQYSMGNVFEAKKTYSHLLSIIDQNTDTHIYASTLNSISSICIRDGEYEKAIYYLSKVDSICQTNSYNDIKLTLLQEYHDLYIKIGDFELANQYLEQYDILNDSIYNIELTEQLNELEIAHQREKSELELKIRDEEISHQKTLNAILFSIIAIVLIFIAVIAFLLVKKNRLNKALKKLNADLKLRDEEISSNLDYAREIQLGCMSNNLTDSNLQMFVLDRPKVVVGGDFYISQTKGDASYVVVGDCTGHGISGGFLSVLGIKSVYEAIEKYDTLPEIASFINNEFCEIVSSAENLKGESLCLSMVRICGNEVRFLGSKQKMWIVSGDKGDCSTARLLACKPEVHEYKSSNAIMGSAVNEEFAEEILNVKSGDVVFLSSDGYPDQFGADGKLKYSRFRNFLQECSQMAPDKAKEFLSAKLDLWRGDLEQTDDVMVVGIYF